MGEEYRKWLENHPDATEEEKKKAWEMHIRKLEARRLVAEMLVSLRY